jgi:DNA-nicking Smr family endonuclease
MGRRERDEDDRAAFEEAMKDVAPLADRHKRLPPPAPGPPRRMPPSDPSDPPVAFERSDSGERIEGRAPGIDRRHLRRLRSGAVPCDARIDLHGLDAAAARAAVRRAVIAAGDAGRRCVLVIHGRGRHSDAAPVLKQALPDWLAESPLGARVMAFASATPRDGGSGATYVLLRRRAGGKAR